MRFIHCTREEFLSRCAGKRIICFGASLMPHEAVRALPIAGQIERVLDNDPAKAGEMLLAGRSVPVCGPDWLAGRELSNHCLLITSRFYYDIAQQLRTVPGLDGLECCAWPCLTLDDESTPEKLYHSRITKQCLENYREYLEACALPAREQQARLGALERELTATPEKKNFLPSVVLLHSDICPLRCEHCCDLLPLVKRPYHLKPDEALRDLDNLLRGLDECIRVDLTDGEAFLYPELAELVRGAAGNPKIRTVFLFTNATVMPSEELLASLRNDKVFIHVSDYGMIGKMAGIIEAFEERGIHFTVLSNMKWKRFGLPQKRTVEPEWLRYEFLRCGNKKCSKPLFRGRLYGCMPAFRMANTGIFSSANDYVTLHAGDAPEEITGKIRRIALTDCIDACHYCRFADESLPYIPAGPSFPGHSAYTLVRRDRLEAMGRGQ